MNRDIDTVAFTVLACLACILALMALRVRSKERRRREEYGADARRTGERIRSVGVERRLRALSGTSDEIFAVLYAPVLKNARHYLDPLRTRVPAAHASTFEVGRALDVAAQFLGQRSVVISHRDKSVTGEREQPCWTYTCYCAVVCCYVLRALQSVEVQVNQGRAGRVWNPIVDSIPTDDQIQAVRVIRAPRLVPGWRNVLLLPRLIPRKGLDWMVRRGDPFSTLACTVTGVAATGRPFCKAVYDALGDSVPDGSDSVSDQSDSDAARMCPQQRSTKCAAPEMDKRSVFEDRLSRADKRAVVENQTDTERGHTKGQAKRRQKQVVVDSVWASG
jgi:hypothetical protein